MNWARSTVLNMLVTIKLTIGEAVMKPELQKTRGYK